MYKLIESNGKEMKEILSSGKVVWFLDDAPKLEFYRGYDFIRINNIDDNWNSIVIKNVVIRKSDGRRSFRDFVITKQSKFREINQAISLERYQAKRFPVEIH